MAIRILVVDDASFIRDMVKKHLRDRIPGVEIFEASDGNRALALTKQHSMDLILSDWEMPNMSGEEFLRELRKKPEGDQIPFVMVTSRGDRSHVIKAAEAGVSDYLTKPFSPEELLRKVAKQLARSGKAPAVDAGRQGSTQGIASASVGVLMGGGARGDKSKKVKGKARLRFSSRGESCLCVIRDLSLQSLTGLIQRGETIPGLFDQAVVNIEGDNEDTTPTGLNGYVHSVQAAEDRPDTTVIKVVIRFVDQNADKLEALSTYIDNL
ncbi:response regulator [Marinimicrobium sp. ABcell2]|uniref:response regulator n=1 Tax=Marinimicrobium sp. ABcell2 TaxID=3069751 RepID=UPI0027B2767C|nr:response regulator [Marinimicrobium sp. ABcell2]MDQ2076947.1 response regulator [Marinimicrobium sp. ABcell2]